MKKRTTFEQMLKAYKEIHCNPWANIRMMEAKAAELGFDLGERYDTRLK